MLHIQWKENARADMLSILTYIAEDNIEAARKFKEDLESRLNSLTKFPQAYKHGRVDGTREMVLTSNYIVIYAEGLEQITILRILHSSRMYP